MTVQPSEGVYGDGAGVTTPIAHRLAQAGKIAKTSGIAIRPGLYWGGTSTIVSGTANMSYNVAAFQAAATRGGTGGAYEFANDGTVNVVTTAAPGSNSRYDVVYAWQRDFAIDGSNSTPVIGVVQGTAAASPSVPSLASFPGAIELARILVPAGVSATNSGTTITQTAPFTASGLAPIPFRNTTERDAGTYVEGQLGWLIDSETLQSYDGSTWNSIGSNRVIPTAATNGSVSTAGVVTSTAQSLVRIRDAFPTTFRVFRITFDVTLSAAAGLDMKFAVNATDASTNYDTQRFTAISSTAAAVQSLASSVALPSPIGVAGARHFGEILVTDVNVAGPTFWKSEATVAPPAAMTTSTGGGVYFGLHRTSTAYNSFSFVPASGTITVNRLTVEGVS